MGSRSDSAKDVGEDIGNPIITLQVLMTGVAEQYSDNVALICKHQPPDFLGQISRQADNTGKPCLRWTHSQLRSIALSFAISLRKSGVKKGTPMAAFLKNGAQYAIGIYAAALLGCAFVHINASLANKADEVQHMLSIAQVQVLMVCDDSMANEITKAMGPQLANQTQVKVICNLSSSSKPVEGWNYLTDMLSEEQSMSLGGEHESRIDDIALIIFTSGTTSQPKAVGKTNCTLVASTRSHA